jgi:hypothetical protein
MSTSTQFISDIADLAKDAFVEDGRVFKAVTQTDLMRGLRERGWKLPGAGFFLNDVEKVGFVVKQGQHFKGPVRRNYPGASCLSRYQTLILAKEPQ